MLRYYTNRDDNYLGSFLTRFYPTMKRMRWLHKLDLALEYRRNNNCVHIYAYAHDQMAKINVFVDAVNQWYKDYFKTEWFKHENKKTSVIYLTAADFV